ncbi:SDR family NAD(P)-dependent oxidoreductase [Thermococcus sp.]|uniref:SDR family NAD(P)-dependent oxidoreductase n=1 Tax=Thermococcus sp. TaxID=35749 RepID=UPI00261FA63B|nr:SDR family NAD(P)-dependent oxidoreductase [Thermococcus sp.]
MELKGKVALVTGASRGIGRAIAVSLSRKGCNIAINYSKDVEGAKKTEELCKSHGVGALVIKADVSNRSEVRNMVERSSQNLVG